jgi:Ferredoxin-dependent bilin reductase./Proto-chlorophyllide reductase 57 kD subunit.
MKSEYLEKSIGIIFNVLQGIISENEYSMISARKNEGDKVTQTIFKTFEADKIDRLTLEEYTINSKSNGVVLNIYPKPEYNIPIFTFQLGGQIPDKVIFVTDIIPTLQKDDLNAAKKLYRRYSQEMKNPGARQGWISEICTEYALVCQYKPMDPEIVLEALSEYLFCWRSLYELAKEPIVAQSDIRVISESIKKFKTILHDNDAGLEIYLKKFGKEALSAIEAAAFGTQIQSADSAIEPTEITETEKAAPESNSGLSWTTDAAEYLQEAPKFIRGKIKANAESKARQSGITQITKEFIEKLRK